MSSMRFTILLLCYLGMVNGNTDTCIKGADNTCVDPAVDDGSNLLQTNINVHTHKLQTTDHSRTTSKKHRYGGYLVRPAREYFKHWSRGAVEHHVKRFIHPQSKDGSKPTPPLSLQGMNTTAVNFLHTYRMHACPAMAKAAGKKNYKLHDSWHEAGPGTAGGQIEHFLLRSSKGSLQYYAKHGQHIISAYPRVCPQALIQRHRVHRAKGQGKHKVRKAKGQGKFKRHPKAAPGKKDKNMTMIDKDDALGIKIDKDKMDESGEPEMLDNNDAAVKDCEDLFHKTAKEMCGEDFDMEVLGAMENIIDGIGVTMMVNISGEMHDLECDFVVNTNNTDAQLLQHKVLTSGVQDILDNLTGSVEMEIDICKADEESTMNETDIEFFQLAKKRPLGELSNYKGFEHVNDHLPKITESVLQKASEVPESYDIRVHFPDCFLDDYKESVRNQGQCGSCWAFASASATMNNLCVSGNAGTQSLKDDTDRYEVSVQSIMSCNEEKKGCEGGYAAAADNAFKNGIIRERDAPYMCSGGDPLDHFDVASGDCDAFPWGGKCEPELAYGGWNWGGAAGVDGESAMMALIADGHSLYVSFDVYANFMAFEGGLREVYMNKVGGYKGGHAVVAVGYGAVDVGLQSSVPYWTIQNSWGDDWADNGYVKFLRGEDFCGIETGAYYMRAWQSTADAPACLDSSSTGLVGGGGPILCEDAITGGYGNLCTDSSWGEMVGGNCPSVCGTCMESGTVGAVPMPGSGPSPPPPATTTTNTTTTLPTTMPPSTFSSSSGSGGGGGSSPGEDNDGSGNSGDYSGDWHDHGTA
eukprot:gnl/MRDRNA2_/MRDRNA2_103307_c0_seq1.p1 gnl/MRDRNA2_/MRDRNA2_103307_c0~~gnl/MRDRNA2_/MRDRNA2_103307_c0_seq1.p1  ORF type:complete len:855 (+),score=130.21 gnl/MRDRNA2_/MRDRNA2_103307_c0_seq1:144-2567(+)